MAATTFETLCARYDAAQTRLEDLFVRELSDQIIGELEIDYSKLIRNQMQYIKLLQGLLSDAGLADVAPIDIDLFI